MGNCTARNRILAQNDEKDKKPREAVAVERTRESTSSSKREPERHVNGGKKKTVRFRLQEEGANGKESRGFSKSGGVRIRAVVTRRELVQILRNESKISSVEQLLSLVKMKNRKVSMVRISQRGTSGGWRPCLDSIPEDHHYLGLGSSLK
ncbi:hypothetical protein U1Q18_024505 [Sarracenia purpurea var. burkii]